MNRSGYAQVALLGLVVTLVSGCGEASKFSSVSGIVTLDGEPVAEATVAFIPKDGDGRTAFGTTAADGSYELSTLKPGDGVLPGNYHVTVTAVDVIQSEKAKAVEFGSLAAEMPMPPPKQEWRAPRTYSKKETSGLEFTVERGSNQADFALKKSS